VALLSGLLTAWLWSNHYTAAAPGCCGSVPDEQYLRLWLPAGFSRLTLFHAAQTYDLSKEPAQASAFVVISVGITARRMAGAEGVVG
jgi:hypothetical protein